MWKTDDASIKHILFWYIYYMYLKLHWNLKTINLPLGWQNDLVCSYRLTGPGGSVKIWIATSTCLNDVIELLADLVTETGQSCLGGIYVFMTVVELSEKSFLESVSGTQESSGTHSDPTWCLSFIYSISVSVSMKFKGRWWTLVSNIVLYLKSINMSVISRNMILHMVLRGEVDGKISRKPP